jgi:hypothetical protein
VLTVAVSSNEGNFSPTVSMDNSLKKLWVSSD